MEPVNHWRPVTTEYQLEFMPRIEALPAPRKRRARAVSVQQVAREEGEAPLAVTCIQWFYFFHAWAYFVFGSILLAYPSSQPAEWLIAHSGILAPFKITAIGAAPLINLLAETFFVLSIATAIIGVMWLMRSLLVRWITMLYAGASLARTVLYFVALKGLAPSSQLSHNQVEVLLADAVVNLLIFSFTAFYPGVDHSFPMPHETPVMVIAKE